MIPVSNIPWRVILLQDSTWSITTDYNILRLLRSFFLLNFASYICNDSEVGLVLLSGIQSVEVRLFVVSESWESLRHDRPKNMKKSAPRTDDFPSSESLYRDGGNAIGMVLYTECIHISTQKARDGHLYMYCKYIGNTIGAYRAAIDRRSHDKGECKLDLYWLELLCSAV